MMPLKNLRKSEKINFINWPKMKKIYKKKFGSEKSLKLGTVKPLSAVGNHLSVISLFILFYVMIFPILTPTLPDTIYILSWSIYCMIEASRLCVSQHKHFLSLCDRYSESVFVGVINYGLTKNIVTCEALRADSELY